MQIKVEEKGLLWSRWHEKYFSWSFHILSLNLGPGRTWQIFVYFAKKFVTSSLRQGIFRSTKFCQGLLNFKDAVVLPRRRTNFCHAWNLTDLSIYTPWFEEKCQSGKFDLYFQSECFNPKRGNQTVKIYTSECCITIFTQDTTITVPKFTFQLQLQGQVLFNLYRLK